MPDDIIVHGRAVQRCLSPSEVNADGLTLAELAHDLEKKLLFRFSATHHGLDAHIVKQL